MIHKNGLDKPGPQVVIAFRPVVSEFPRACPPAGFRSEGGPEDDREDAPGLLQSITGGFVQDAGLTPTYPTYTISRR